MLGAPPRRLLQNTREAGALQNDHQSHESTTAEELGRQRNVSGTLISSPSLVVLICILRRLGSVPELARFPGVQIGAVIEG